MDQGSNKNHSPAYNFTPTVTKFCVMWEGLSLPHDTKFGNCRCKIVDSRSFHSWSLIHGLRWSGLIKVGPGDKASMLINHWCIHMCQHASINLRKFKKKSKMKISKINFSTMTDIYILLECWLAFGDQLSQFYFNSLWPSDAIWCPWSRSTLAQIMACYLTTHFLNQYWLIITGFFCGIHLRAFSC